MKKLTINNREDGQDLIDAIGDNEATIKRLQAENKKMRALFEEWALANPDEAFENTSLMEDETEKYVYRMVKSDPALRVQTHLTVEDVVAKLGADPATERYVKKTYSPEEIKADFGANEKKRRQVEQFGLYFTRPEPHLKVEEK